MQTIHDSLSQFDITLPKISIVTPSYNQGGFLEKTIRSVLEQDYPNLEYFVIDGGSKDESIEIIQKYEDQLAGWVSEPDKGQSHAINKGFTRCTGDIIAWLNSDDLYYPGALKFVANYFLDHPEVGMLYGDAEIVDSIGTFVKHRKELAFDRTMGILIGWGLLIPQPAAFFRKEVIETIGFLNEQFQYALDAEYWMRVNRHHKIVHVPKLLAKACYHPKTKTSQMVKMNEKYQAETYQILRESFKDLRISKWISFRLIGIIARIYRIKRIFLRLVHGHYFKGYVLESKLQQQLARKDEIF